MQPSCKFSSTRQWSSVFNYIHWGKLSSHQPLAFLAILFGILRVSYKIFGTYLLAFFSTPHPIHQTISYLVSSYFWNLALSFHTIIQLLALNISMSSHPFTHKQPYKSLVYQSSSTTVTAAIHNTTSFWRHVRSIMAACNTVITMIDESVLRQVHRTYIVRLFILLLVDYTVDRTIE